MKGLPKVYVREQGKTLTKNTDYTLRFDNNVNVGTATVYITGIGSYTGEVVLLAQMIRYADIPAGYYSLSLVNHACTVFWLDGEWYTTDGTFYCKGCTIYRSAEEYMTPVSNGISCLSEGISRLGFNIVGGTLYSW